MTDDTLRISELRQSVGHAMDEILNGADVAERISRPRFWFFGVFGPLNTPGNSGYLISNLAQDSVMEIMADHIQRHDLAVKPAKGSG
jgi:hypothetical protein